MNLTHVTDPVVSVKNLVVEARRAGRWQPVVEGVDFEVRAGELCGIVGETGAGKTLTTRAMLGLLPRGTRAYGEIRTHAPTDDAAPLRRSVLGRDLTVVLQNPTTALDPLRRVRAQLTEGVLYHGLFTREAALQRAVSLLRRLRFEDPEHVLGLFPHELSGGMAQRVLIACALMPRPHVLVVDEPTSALDANVRVEVLELLRGLCQEESVATVLVSHDLRLVARFCDRIVVLYAGRVVERGPTATVLAQPQHPYTGALLRCSITTEVRGRQRLGTIPGLPPAPEEWPSGCVFRPRCPRAFDRCEAERPVLAPGQARSAACHLADQRDVKAADERER